MTNTIPSIDSRQDHFFLVVNFGAVKKTDPNYRMQVCCDVCNTPHPAHELAVVDTPAERFFVPVCNECSNDPHNVVKSIIRKYLAALEKIIKDVPVSARVGINTTIN